MLKFLFKWFVILIVLVSLGVWFILSNALNNVDMVRDAKNYTRQTVSDYLQTKKNQAIAKTLDKLGYKPPVNVIPATDIPASSGIVVPVPKTQKDITKVTNADSQKEAVAQTSSDFTHLSIPFFYDGSDAPQNLTHDKVLGLVSQASDAWNQACNVSFVYKGDRLSDYVDNDNTINRHEGLVKWGDLQGDAIGQAHQGNAQGPAEGFVLTLKPSFFAKKSNESYLYSTVLHEMGHVLGLGHSKNPNSIMFWQQSERKQVLNATDKAMCQYFRARWSGMTEEQASDKYGVLVNESATQETSD